ncbi:MAG: 3-isopropylmalate dehydratase small subunit [Candidatus Hadarchaeales archaeon]
MPKVWVFGDNVSTDDIIAGKYLTSTDPVYLASHVMENLDPEFARRVGRGDVILAGKNFGCGSSREHAPLALKAAGISAVVARSFARIFFRNSINLGLPPLTCETTEGFQGGDEVRLDLESFTLHNLRSGAVLKLSPLPPFILQILRAGGMVEYLRRRCASGP